MPRATTGLAYLSLSLVLLGSLVFTVFVTVPQQRAYQQAKADLKTKLKERDERKQFLVSIDDRKKQLDSLSRDAVALSVTFPDEPALANSLAVLQSMAVASGVQVLSASEPKKADVEPEKAAPPPELSRSPAERENVEKGGEETPVVPMSQKEPSARLMQWDTPLKIRGTYAQVRAFVRELEKSLILADVQSFKLGGSQKEEAANPQGQQSAPSVSGQLAGEIVVRTYTLPFSSLPSAL